MNYCSVKYYRCATNHFAEHNAIQHRYLLRDGHHLSRELRRINHPSISTVACLHPPTASPSRAPTTSLPCAHPGTVAQTVPSIAALSIEPPRLAHLLQYPSHCTVRHAIQKCYECVLELFYFLKVISYTTYYASYLNSKFLSVLLVYLTLSQI